MHYFQVNKPILEVFISFVKLMGLNSLFKTKPSQNISHKPGKAQNNTYLPGKSMGLTATVSIATMLRKKNWAGGWVVDDISNTAG